MARAMSQEFLAKTYRSHYVCAQLSVTDTDIYADENSGENPSLGSAESFGKFV